ncbi:MAG: hypothetical protein ACKV2Q_14360 [Planctomycetaceae bacterium]
MTLTQIQAAAGELPLAEKQELLHFLRGQLQRTRPTNPRSRQQWLAELEQTAKTLKTGIPGDDLQTILDELRTDR